MTEPGNTFESNQADSSGSEGHNNSAAVDNGVGTATETNAGENTSATSATTSAPTDAPATQAEPAAPVEPATATEPVAASEPEIADAPVAEPQQSPEPSASGNEATETTVAAEDAAAPQQEGASQEGAESAEPADAEGQAEGGRRGGRGGRQVPKIPEEQMREIWSELTAKKNAGESIELEVVSTNRGGVVAQYNGVEVFIPVSHWSLDRHNTEGITHVQPGDKLMAHVLEITNFDTDARRVTATRRTLLRKDLMGSLEVGQRMKGRVASILDFGAFIDLGGVDGLVHASEISYDRTKRPNELLNKGDEVEVIVREIDREKKRIYLGLKELLPSPWEGVEERFPIGTIQHGKVVGLGKTGAFIELEPGLEGFVRASELSWTKRINNPKEVLRKGMDIDVKVLDSSSKKERLSLSFRQAQEDPWETIATKYFVGSRWEGEVREISNKGVVVGIDDVEGFLPRGRMGRESKRPPEMKAGDKLTVHVIEVDPEAHSLIFGLPRAEGEEEPQRHEQRGGGGGGERRGGGGGRGERRDGDGFRGGDRGGRGERFGGPVTAVNELKTAETVSNFALGDMIGDAIKKRLNYKEAEQPKEAPKAQSAPAPAPAAAPAAAEPSQTAAAPVEPASQPAAEENTPAVANEPAGETSTATDAGTTETGSVETAPDATQSESTSGDVGYTTSFEQGDDTARSDEERAV